MKKATVVLLLILSLFLISCTPNSLDTTNLTKVNNSGNQKNDPIIYKASTVKESLNSLPFKMKLPNKFPFDTKGFQSEEIQDFKHDGKNILAQFTAFSNDKKNILIIAANNFNSTYTGGSSEKVKLDNGIVGDYSGGTSLTFKFKDIIYNVSLSFNSNTIDKDQQKNDLIKLANQIID